MHLDPHKQIGAETGSGNHYEVSTRGFEHETAYADIRIFRILHRRNAPVYLFSVILVVCKHLTDSFSPDNHLAMGVHEKLTRCIKEVGLVSYTT